MAEKAAAGVAAASQGQSARGRLRLPLQVQDTLPRPRALPSSRSTLKKKKKCLDNPGYFRGTG